jgi:hypothetical protein
MHKIASFHNTSNILMFQRWIPLNQKYLIFDIILIHESFGANFYLT